MKTSVCWCIFLHSSIIMPDSQRAMASNIAGWPSGSKFALLAYLYRLRKDHETVPWEIYVRGEFEIMKGKHRETGPDIDSQISRVKAAITDEELDEIFEEPVVVVDHTNIDIAETTMDFKKRFREESHKIDIDHLMERFGKQLKVTLAQKAKKEVPAAVAE
eukprot:m.342861 g.342861  ORF g.342861 m.342861 type:complete len:161 (+) comp20623_c0_seq9:125-607(+)